MVTYEYLCPECGRFEVRLPMGAAPPTRDCPACERAARRVLSAPRLSRVSPALSAALDRGERSREAPEVVPAPPGRRAVRPPHPATARLPRP
ncbi:FmdB family zinc ribbon protein [Streptosporangium pseudovulgare]|uniref:Putative regulatory protein FmdB zinc ribbon domain-containing protein n=1 Tax=Streptosporangium pseudovulgare TaxID=35765 RepID=A0ABQ2QYK3_9ACTN|nr:zinc ribbon domain-containing protein [Streptosporangium pseudovulgare]GGP99641.1 hypothetical protein GCM10010140_32100 [Streptosporangium pseudovulgare]